MEAKFNPFISFINQLETIDHLKPSQPITMPDILKPPTRSRANIYDCLNCNSINSRYREMRIFICRFCGDESDN